MPRLCAVSIHAPARVRPLAFGRPRVSEVFQSTHPQGCDHGQQIIPSGFPVSIHAPARVRPPSSTTGSWTSWFQSTHPQGCDPPPLNILNPGPEKADPREPHPEVMPRNAHAYFVEFNHLKCRENFSREPPGDSMGAWGSRVRRCGSAVASATGRGDLPGPAAPPVTQPASTGQDPAPVGPESRARWGLWRCCGRRTAW